MINNITILQTDVLSDNWYTLKKVTYQYQKQNGEIHVQSQEAYDRGNGAVVLLYNKSKQTVILTRQFRLPTYVNGNATGMMIEAPAGVLHTESPEEGIRRETEEETGYVIQELQKVFEVYSSPGSVTEILHCYIAPYNAGMQLHKGGGVAEEEENIEVLEINFSEALGMIKDGAIKDAKTILLLQHLRLENIL